MAINKDLIRWAVDRSGEEESALVERFPRLPQWESGEVQPTFRQLESFAKATLTPFGAFFLPVPPEEKLPLPDFRVGYRFGSAVIRAVHLEWYHNV